VRLTAARADLLAAFMLLTRLPVAWLGNSGMPADLARCVWAFPVVGLVVNGLGGLLYWLAHRFGMPPLVAGAWVLAATLIATGALHEDGLADTADGFGGGTTPVRKLEIMRDSRIGSYGALALLLSVVVRVAAIGELTRPRPVVTALIVAGMLGRTGMLVPLLLLRPARGDGMGAAVGKVPASSAVAGFGLAVAACWVLLPVRSAIAAVLLGFGAAWAVARLAQAQIGGYTGDVLGASEVIAECVVLSAAAGALGG
jgi:adenosylcobinamide-GDP ribazoletransferase